MFSESPTGRTSRAAFSLPEFMAVCAILAMLAILIAPARQKLRQQANSATNQANIRTLCLANLLYVGEKGYFADANSDGYGDGDVYMHWASRVAEYAGFPPLSPEDPDDSRFVPDEPPPGVFLRPGDTWVFGEANPREPSRYRYLSSYLRNWTFNGGPTSIRSRKTIQFRRQMRYPSEIWMISDLYDYYGDANDTTWNPGFFGGYYTFGMGDASLRVFPAGQIPPRTSSEVADRRFWDATYPRPAPPLSPVQEYRFDFGLAYDGSEDALSDAQDGVPNLHKYAFNMLGRLPGQKINLSQANTTVVDPVAGGAGLPNIRLNAQGHLTVTYIRRLYTASSLGYEVQFCDDLALGDWAPNPAATTSTTSTPYGYDANRVTVTDSVPSARRFARVKVTVLP
jgi:type II secretory pathway pseudopilin PulG